MSLGLLCPGQDAQDRELSARSPALVRTEANGGRAPGGGVITGIRAAGPEGVDGDKGWEDDQFTSTGDHPVGMRMEPVMEPEGRCGRKWDWE